MKPKALFVMLILWLSFTTIQARSTEDVPDKGTYAKFLLVGCYMKSDEEGVRMYRFDGQTADVDYPCGLRGISNPAFLTSDSTGNRIYWEVIHVHMYLVLHLENIKWHRC